MITEKVKDAHKKETELHEHYKKMDGTVKKHAEVLGKIDAAVELSKIHRKSSKPGTKKHHMIAHKQHLSIAQLANELEAAGKEHIRMAQELRKLANDGAEKHRKAADSVE